MLTGRLVSCKTAIDAVYGDANLEVNIEEALRWIARTLDFIGSPIIMHTIVTNGLTNEDGIIYTPIPVVAYRAELPSNIQSIITCANYETKQMLYEITDTLYKSYSDTNYPNILQENSYVVNNNYIFTGFESGYLELAYNAYPVDSDGFPLIPEDEAVLEAIKWTIIKNMDYMSWRSGKITRDIYENSNREYNWYIGKASNRASIPNIDRMESWMRATIQLLPRLKLHNTAFRQPQKSTFVHTPNFYNKLNIIGDSQSILLNMNLYGVTGSNSTNNVLYWNFTNSGTTRTLNIYSESTKTSLVAHASGEVLNGNSLKVVISEDNSSGLSGDVTISISSSGVTDDTSSDNMIVFYNA